MAKMRVVNTRFWVDDYISNLDPIEKLLFLYFLTNTATEICGIYEVPLKTVATDTGIEIEMVKKILRRFSRDKRIFYVDGWVAIKNFIKHQSVNPKVEEGIKQGLNKAPKELREKIKDSLSIAYTKPMDSLSHLNSNSNSNLINTSAPAKPAPVVRKGKVKTEDVPMTCNEYVQWMRKSEQPHVLIIAEYADEVHPEYTTKAQWESFTRRNLRTAKRISPFSMDQISAAMAKMQKDLKTKENPKGYITKWGLETLEKYLIV